MKITIEINGQILDIPEDCIDPESVLLSLPRDFEEASCECPGGPCGYVHRKLTGTGSISLSAKLAGQPLWRAV